MFVKLQLGGLVSDLALIILAAPPYARTKILETLKIGVGFRLDGYGPFQTSAES